MKSMKKPKLIKYIDSYVIPINIFIYLLSFCNIEIIYELAKIQINKKCLEITTNFL